MKRQLTAIAFAAFLATPLLAGRGGGGSSHSGSSHGGSTTPSSSSSSDSKSVHVNGYTKKDGTYFSGYWRSSPGTAVHNPTNEREAAVSNMVTPAENETTAATEATTRATAVVRPHVSVRVLADPRTKRYYRQTCAAPPSAVAMTRSSAIAAGYRPDPGCYATPAR